MDRPCGRTVKESDGHPNGCRTYSMVVSSTVHHAVKCLSIGKCCTAMIFSLRELLIPLTTGRYLRAAWEEIELAHTQRNKESLLGRIRRIRGQVEALERALEEEEDCASILQQIAACRGAINGLMTELIEGEVRHHVLSPNAKPGSNRALAAERLIQVLHTYLK